LFFHILALPAASESSKAEHAEPDDAELASAARSVDELCDMMHAHATNLAVQRAGVRRLLTWVSVTDLDEVASVIEEREAALRTLRPVRVLRAALERFPADREVQRSARSALRVCFARAGADGVWEGVGELCAAARPLAHRALSAEGVACAVGGRALRAVGAARVRKTHADAEALATRLYTAFVRLAKFDIAARFRAPGGGFVALPAPLRAMLRRALDKHSFADALWFLFALVHAAAEREFVQFLDLIVATLLDVAGGHSAEEIASVLDTRSLPPPRLEECADPTMDHRLRCERWSSAARSGAGPAEVSALLRAGARSGLAPPTTWHLVADRLYFDLLARAEAETRVLWGTDARGSRGATLGSVLYVSSEDGDGGTGDRGKGLHTAANLHRGIAGWKSAAVLREGAVEHIEIDLSCDAVIDKIVVRTQTEMCDVRVLGELSTFGLRTSVARDFSVVLLPWGSAATGCAVERCISSGEWLSSAGSFHTLRVEARHRCGIRVEVGVVELVVFGRGLLWGSNGLMGAS